MFRQGKKPAVIFAESAQHRARRALERAGYVPHTGMRYERRGEICAWSKDLPGGRHVHVQEVRWRDGVIALFAHTEVKSGLGHVLSALRDRANYSAGARTLRRDLTREGFFKPRPFPF